MGQSHAKAKKDMTPEEFDQMVRTSSFSREEVHDLHEQFQAEFPKGFIDKKGFKQAYGKFYPQGNGGDKFVDHVFRIYDADNNGQISFQEFMATLHVSAQGTPEEKLRASFRLYDVDRNGSISEKELAEILAAVYKSRNEPNAAKKAKEQAAIIMRKLDTDHNKKLSEAEFLRAAVECPGILPILQST